MVDKKKEQGQRKKGSPHSAGRRKGKIAFYYANRFAENKLRNVLRSSGIAEANAWAKKNDAENVLVRLLKNPKWERLEKKRQERGRSRRTKRDAREKEMRPEVSN